MNNMRQTNKEEIKSAKNKTEMNDDSEITPPTPEEPATDGTFSEEEGVNTPNIGDNMQNGQMQK